MIKLLKIIECWFAKRHVYANFSDGKSLKMKRKCVRCGRIE